MEMGNWTISSFATGTGLLTRSSCKVRCLSRCRHNPKGEDNYFHQLAERKDLLASGDFWGAEVGLFGGFTLTMACVDQKEGAGQ